MAEEFNITEIIFLVQRIQSYIIMCIIVLIIEYSNCFCELRYMIVGKIIFGIYTKNCFIFNRAMNVSEGWSFCLRNWVRIIE